MTRSLALKLKIVLLIISCFQLSSCYLINAWFNDEDNAMPPTVLKGINEKVQLKTKWSVDTGVGTDDAFVQLKPVIYENQIIVIDRKGLLSAYDKTNGKSLWKKDLDTVVSGGLGEAGDKVFFSNDRAELVAVSISSGKTLWSKKLSSISLSQVVSTRGVVISRTLDGKLYGLSVDKGEQLWIYDAGVPVLTYRGNSSPIIDAIGGVVFTGMDNGKVVAIDVESGHVIWEATTSLAIGRTDIERMVDIDGDPVFVDGQLFVVSMNGKVSAIDVTTGKINWSRKMSSFVGMSYDWRNIYITDNEDNLWALGQENGDIVWKQDKLKYRKLTAPSTIVNGIIVSDNEGYTHVLSAVDGALIGRKQLDKSGFLLPALINEYSIFLYGKDGNLQMVQTKE